MITIVQLARAVKALVAFLARHPLATLTAAVLGWPGAGSAGPARSSSPPSIAAVLAVWRWRWRASFSRHVLGRVRGKWRRWHYRRHWAAVMTIGRLAPVYRGRLLLPVLGKVTSTPFTDRVLTGIVSGQSADDFARRAENLAHGFGALLCRVRSARPGWLVLEFVRRDALAAIIPALPIPRPGRPQGAGHRPPRGRLAVAGPAARHPPAGRRGHRRRERPRSSGA